MAAITELIETIRMELFIRRAPSKKIRDQLRAVQPYGTPLHARCSNESKAASGCSGPCNSTRDAGQSSYVAVVSNQSERSTRVLRKSEDLTPGPSFYGHRESGQMSTVCYNFCVSAVLSSRNFRALSSVG